MTAMPKRGAMASTVRVGKIDDPVWADGGDRSMAGTPASLTAPYTAPRVQWTEVARTISLRPVYTGVLNSHPNSAVCAMALYVPAGGGHRWAYPLSGGP